MPNYAVIVDNGGGPNLVYHDVVGIEYTFPKLYQKILVPGTQVIYYRSGKNEDNKHLKRLLEGPHYFGTATIGAISDTEFNNLRAEILDYKEFQYGVPFQKADGSHYETSDGRFWRNGVRIITEAEYNEIVNASNFPPAPVEKVKTGTGAKTTKTLEYVKSSKVFADGQLQVVVAKTGYHLLSIADGVFYKLAPLKEIKHNFGEVKIFGNGNRFLVRHQTASIEVIVGTIEITNTGVLFDKHLVIKDGTLMAL